jgi:cyclic pyranopterin phosphate synthase
MPMAGGEMYIPGELLSAAEIRSLILAAHPGSQLCADGGGPARGAGPARYWRLEGPPGGAAGQEPRRVGIISPMTEHFCEACNRVRLSAAGALHVCLGHDDAADLRDALHAGGQRAVVGAIRQAVAAKRPSHTFGLIGIGGPRKSMISIGG